MSIPYVTFRPADYHRGKDSYIVYYSLNPETEHLERIRIRLNHIRKQADRDKYARVLVHELNTKLWGGWNPFLEKMSAKSVTIEEGISRFLDVKSKSCRPATLKAYNSFSRIFGDWTKKCGINRRFCLQFDKQTLISFIDSQDRTRNLTNRSYNNYCMFLFTLFDFFVERGYMKENPAGGLSRRRVDRKQRTVIPPEDRAKIRAWFEARIPRYVWVMMLCYRLFIRPKEICGLKIGNIDFEDETIKIPAELAKNHCDRVLGVPDDLMAYFRTLQAYPLHYYIFADRNTYDPGPKMMAPTRIAERWKQMRDELKLPASYQFYSLKDTGITEMLEAGVPAKYVKELADHHSLEMTERYTHRSEAKKILEWNRLEF